RPVLAGAAAVLVVLALGAAAWVLLPEADGDEAAPRGASPTEVAPPPATEPEVPELVPRPRIPRGTDPLEGALLAPGDVAPDAVGQRDGPVQAVSPTALRDEELSPACRQYHEAVGRGHDPTTLGLFV